MGARLSLLAPSAPTVAISSYVDVLGSFQYVELINNSRFLKTIKAIDMESGNAVIIKILIKPSDNVHSFNINLQSYTELMVKEASLLSQLNGCLPTSKFIETDRAAYLIRQSVKTNLYDRLSIRPFLEPIEKKFLVFQILKLMEQLHDKLSIRHGDLKLENFMVSGSNWVTLTDFASYTKPVYIPEDNPNQFSFYFDTSKRRVCNLAPERFYNSRNGSQNPQNFDDNDTFNGKNQVTDAMDLFGLGCIIGELYLDGEPLFTLSGLFRYLKNEYTPDLSGINDANVISMIKSLIKFDPKERPPASQLLNDYKNIFFPQSFYSFLYVFAKSLNDNTAFQVNPKDKHLTSSDLRISYIYDNFDKIALNLEFNYKNNSSGSSMNLNLPGMPYNYNIKPSSEFFLSSDTEKGSLIILNIVFTLVNTLKQPLSKIKACELILALSERTSDACKLDRSLPYLCKILDEYMDRSLSRRYEPMNLLDPSLGDANSESYSSKAVIVALDCIVALLHSCSYITPLNVSVITEYLLPKLNKLLNLDNDKENELVKIKVASCFPKIAEISLRFWTMARALKIRSINSNSLFGPIKETSEEGILQSKLSTPKETLYAVIEDISSVILTDPNPKVRAALVDNIEPLCIFFGIDKTNDIILPHLITYLNDPDTELKIHFLESLVFLAQYVGVLAFEQYLLPLLIQTLGDSEQLVVLKVLEAFVKFTSLKLVNPLSEFNALSIYKELLENTVHLLLHPNEWIRQSVIELILEIKNNLLNADIYCFLYPQIKQYLSYDITTLDWYNLFPCLTPPLSKIVYQMLLSWANMKNEKSLFWKQENITLTGPSKYTSFSKELGKSVFVPSRSENSYSIYNRSNSHHSAPLTHEDKQWLLKVKAVGLDEKDFWKIFTLRGYVQQVSRNMSLHGNRMSNSFLEVQTLNLTPRNIFFDIAYKSEVVATASKGLSSSVVHDFNMTEPQKSERSDSMSLVLPNFSKVSASIQMVEENVFGELELQKDHEKHSNGKHTNNLYDPGATHKVISTNNDKVIISNIKHSYTGNNPNILRYLQSVEFDLSVNSFSEFGDPIKIPTNRSDRWDPKCKCISQINSNSDPGSPDSLSCLAVNPLSEFFITGSESGILKVWDTKKLERNIMMKNASVTAQFKSAITKICFINNRDVFAVGTKDGRIRLLRVDTTRGKNKNIVKYSKLVTIRKYELQDGEYASWLLFHTQNSSTTLLVATSKSRVLMLNVITMECEFLLQNPLIHGIPTSLVYSAKEGWLIVGTSKGRLCLWDVRFEVLVKSYKLNSKDTRSNVLIRNLILLPPHYKPEKKASHLAVLGGTSESDITIWEVPSFECREILCSYNANPKIKQYFMEEIKNENNLNDIIDDLAIDFERISIGDSLGSMTLQEDPKGLFLINSLPDGKLIFWDLVDTEKSISSSRYSFTRSLVKRDLAVTNEKLIQLEEPTSKSRLFFINDMGVLASPYEMIITADKGGILTIMT